MHHPIDIAHPDILPLRAHGNQQIETGDRRSACAGGNDLDVRQLLAVQQQRVADGGADDDGGAMLVVMKYRDLHALFELRLNLETLRALDILKIDAAEGRLQRGHCLDDPFDRVRRYLDVEHVDASKFLEQNGLALHDRLRRQRADIAKSEHGGAVGDDCNKIGAGR